MAKKLSVYLPDDLWERALALGTPSGEKLNSSGLVQRALELMLQERDERAAALGAGAVIDRDRFEAVLAHVRADARAEYERGYTCGLELIEIVGFEGLCWIVESIALGKGIADALEVVIHDNPADQDWWESYRYHFDGDVPRNVDAFRAGAEKAVEDVWSSLHSEGWGADGRTVETPEAPADALDGEPKTL